MSMFHYLSFYVTNDPLSDISVSRRSSAARCPSGVPGRGDCHRQPTGLIVFTQQLPDRPARRVLRDERRPTMAGVRRAAPAAVCRTCLPRRWADFVLVGPGRARQLARRAAARGTYIQPTRRELFTFLFSFSSFSLIWLALSALLN